MNDKLGMLTIGTGAGINVTCEEVWPVLAKILKGENVEDKNTGAIALNHMWLCPECLKKFVDSLPDKTNL